MIESYVVEAGENFYTLADRLAPDADRHVAAQYLLRAAGNPATIHPDQILWFDTEAIELAPVVVEEPPAEEPPTEEPPVEEMPVAVWLEVDPGSGSMSGRRRIVVPSDEDYPDSYGVTFLLNGDVNRTDPTGRREGSEFHTYPPITLAAGDVLRAEWVDESGVACAVEHTVPGTPDEPAAEPPAEEPGPVPTPSPDGRPDATNTGHDGNLTRTFGGVTISDAWLAANNDGSRIIENVRFTSGIKVTADGITIRNFAIEGGRYGVDNGVFSGNPSQGLVLEDGEITGQSSSGLAVSNCTARRLHIHHQAADAVKNWNNVVVEDCYVHHLGSLDGSHSDGVQMRSGKGLVVRRTNFEMRHDEPGFTNSQVFMIQAADGTIDDVLIDGCWINGGGFSVQIKDKGKGVPTNVRLTNNRFGRDYQFGILSLSGSIVNTGNVWDDTGEPI